MTNQINPQKLMLSFKAVNKHFGSNHVINNVNLDIHQGEVVVVCGPSGSGKSTLIRTVNQLEKIESGEIWVDGVNVADSKTDLNKIRTEVGFVFQHFNLYPHLTVLENITLSPIKVKNMDVAAAEKLAMELLDKVGLAHKKDAYPTELSGGQRQRVAIARAIVNDPALIIADEPTGNLDPETSWEIMDIFRRINDAGATIVMATHDKNIVDTMKRRVIAIESGRIVRDEVKGGYGYEA